MIFGNCLQNVAFLKPAYQSTDQASNVASRAVDGKSSTMSRTVWQKNPYWQTNLGSVYEIKTVKLHLNEKKLNKMKNFILRIRNSDKLTWQYKYHGIPSVSTLTIHVPEGAATGNKVKVLIKGNSRQLELKEVEVLAFAA